ncbi:hypothetical protein AB0M34_05450 [Nocardia sp. NPDC050193]
MSSESPLLAAGTRSASTVMKGRSVRGPVSTVATQYTPVAAQPAARTVADE